MTDRGQELTFLSDLHLAAGDALDPFQDDAALVALLDDLAETARAGGPERRLVLLGDCLDIVLAGGSGGDADRAISALERIVAAHREVFAALRRVRAAGVAVEFVPGNHDGELTLASVARVLGAVVPGAIVRPWLVHEPGLVVAEHGQQHHAVNRFRSLAALATGGAHSLGALPPAVRYDALRVRRGSAVARAARLALAAPRLALGVVRAGRRRRVRRAACGLGRQVLDQLDAAAAASARADARRLARGAARRPGTPSLAAMLPGAAARVHGILARSGAAVPFLVFGHSHVAADIPLASAAPRARYLNCGSWVGGSRTLVTVGRSAAGVPYARLEEWDVAARLRRAAAA